MAEAPPPITPEAREAAAIASWVEAMLRSLVATWNSPDLSPTVSFLTAEKDSAEKAVDVSSLTAFYEDITNNPSKIVASAIDAPEKLIAFLVHVVTGLTIPEDIIKTMVLGESSEDVRQKLGQIVKTLYDETLRTEGVREGYLNRDPGEAGWTVFKSLIGASMRLQVGDLIATWGGKKIPFGLGDLFSELAEKLDKAIALEDAIEEVIQVPMQALIQRALEQYYNAILKPADLSDSQARQAERAGLLKPGVLGKILDNLGVRDDIRDALWQLDAPNMTEAEIDQLYQRNLVDIEKVKEIYKGKTVIEPELSWKVALVKGQRRWKLEEQVKELYGNLYRDGVATKAEVTPYLESLGYESDEVDMWFLAQELERRQRRWLTKSDVSGLLKAQKWTVAQARDYMVLQGMTVEDATLLFVEEIQTEAIRALPKAVRDECAEILDPEAILKGLVGELLQLTGLSTLADANTLKLLQCLFDKLTGTKPTP